MKRIARLGCVLSVLLAGAAYGESQHPFPEMERAVEQFDRAKLPAHPRLVLNRREMTRVAGAARSDWGKPHWEIIREYVEQGRKVEPPADPTGYPGGKWNVNDWRRIVAIGDEYQTRILSASLAAVVTGDERDVAEAKRWALAAAKLNPVGMTGIRGVDHPARDILHAVALSYDWLYDKYTPDERAALRDCMTARGREMYKYLNPLRGDAWNNHVWFETSALVDAGLALADEVPEADAWWRYGSQLYLTEFLPKGGRDGDWHEGTHYVAYTLMFVYQWADALKSATGIDAYQVPWLQKVGYFCLMISPPKAGGIQFNDNNYTPPNLLDKVNAYVCARVTRDPVLQWYGDQIEVPPGETQVRQQLGLLMAHDASIPSKPPGADLPLGVWYRDSGWAVMRTDLASSDDVQFGLKGGRYYGSTKSRGHDHPDQNSFLLNFLGQPLAVDSGYYDYYGSPHHNGWTFTGKAHNTLLVDGREELVGKDGQILTFVSDRDGMDFVESEAAGTYPAGLLSSWRRQVLFLRPDLFIVRDLVKPTTPATIAWLLHGPSEFRIDGQKLTVRNGNATLAGEMILPAGLNLSQQGGFPKDAQPERKKPGDYPDQWHLSMTTPGKVDAAEFVFEMRPGNGDVTLPPVTRGPHADGVAFYAVEEPDGRRTQIACLDGTGQMNTADATVTARFWAERGGGNDATSATLCSRVTHLALRGKLVWESGKPADISGLRDGNGWRRVSVRLDEPATIGLPVADVAKLRVDGKEVKAEYDSATRTASLSLDAGTHILQDR